MKTNCRSVAVALLALVLCGAATLSYAQQSDQTGSSATWNGHRHGHMEYLARQLDLTDAQKAEIKTMMQAQRATLHPLMQQMHSLDQQLKQYTEGTYDEAKVQALVTQQSQTLVQLKVEETRIHNELYQLLTPDQQAKLKEIEANREARMQQHMQGDAPATPEQ